MDSSHKELKKQQADALPVFSEASRVYTLHSQCRVSAMEQNLQNLC